LRFIIYVAQLASTVYTATTLVVNRPSPPQWE